MAHVVRQIWSLCIRRERWQLGFLLILLLARAGFAMIGVVSIMPFMSVVADPDVIQRNVHIARAYDALGFTTTSSFLTALGISIVVLLAFSNAVSALGVYGTLRFSWGMHHRVCTRLMKGYLTQPYAFFVARNTAGLNKTLLSEVGSVVTGVLRPSLDLVARFLTVCAMVGLLVVVDPLLATTVTVVLGAVYGAIYFFVRGKQRGLGAAKVKANRERYKISGEAFGGIKDVKVLQRESEFLDRFKPASWKYTRAMASNAMVAQLPRYVVETLAFCGIVLLVVYYLHLDQGASQALPVISLYAFAGYRLMPELQSLFTDVATIRFNRAALDDLLEDYHGWTEALPARLPDALPFSRNIVVEDVVFRYANSSDAALDGVNLRIERNQTIGLVGASGSGKTTLVDLLLGLYQPERGRILIDGVPLDGPTIGAWRRRVGYVPQHIFLTDDTVAANIAFGVPKQEIDLAAVERAARIANLHEFLMTLPAGYDTTVGERGVRLSGGQRQRIGIARALYHDPAVLVMDEATSALDGATETAVMEAIQELAGQKTIILIAHRLSTVQDCDTIYLLERGRVQDRGTYDELVHRSLSFRVMAKLDVATPA
jgi:ATP-binding cassette, subfamily B, bacterial PglK